LTAQLFLVAILALQGQTNPVAGSIRGVVVNASQGMKSVGNAEVVLRVQLAGQLVVAAEGLADEQGRFKFDNIPADADYVYLPGANFDGVHYPGSRVKLSRQQPHAEVKLPIHETVTAPNPLVLRRHDISIHPESDALRVTETLLIDNPGNETYVGQPAREGGRATTLSLSIPSDFRRTTFQSEFWGKNFTLFENRLVTDVPWTPGERELAFTYVLPNDDRNRIWQRPLDLPCEHLRIEVFAQVPDEVTCNLSRAEIQQQGTATFESNAQLLSANHVIRVQFGGLPVTWATFGRWMALGILVVLILVTGLIGFLHRRKNQSQPGDLPVSGASKRAA
jgi:hypothetical protein